MWYTDDHPIGEKVEAGHSPEGAHIIRPSGKAGTCSREENAWEGSRLGVSLAVLTLPLVEERTSSPNQETGTKQAHMHSGSR